METRINESGQVEIIDRQDAVNYVNSKLNEIKVYKEQIERIDKELRDLVSIK